MRTIFFVKPAVLSLAVLAVAFGQQKGPPPQPSGGDWPCFRGQAGWASPAIVAYP
jgi:hypothetical protein